MARSTSVNTSSEPYDFDSPRAVSGVLPHGAGSGNRSFATLSARRTSDMPAASLAARLSMECAALAFVALARILSACDVS